MSCELPVDRAEIRSEVIRKSGRSAFANPNAHILNRQNSSGFD